MVKGLFIPADLRQPLKTVEIEPGGLAAAVNAEFVQRATYDYDTEHWVDDTGRIDGKPMNNLATAYIKTHSQAAKQGKFEHADPSYGLYGDVVITGTDLTDVPEDMINYFQYFQTKSVRS